jgi:TrmH family RNA methyltransferase
VLGEALRAGATIESVYLDPGAGEAERVVADGCLAAGARVFELEAGVLARVTETVSPQPIVGVVNTVAMSLSTLGAAAPDLLVVCSDVRDPGNAGTVLRSAEASGAGGVVFCDGSVDAFNPKTVRASAGAVFHVPVVNGAGTVETLTALGSWGLRRLGATAHDGVDYLDADLAGPVAIVVGNEAHGLAAEALAELDGLVTIPMAGRSESLNVGMATAVLCFEAARQRRRS